MKIAATNIGGAGARRPLLGSPQSILGRLRAGPSMVPTDDLGSSWVSFRDLDLTAGKVQGTMHIEYGGASLEMMAMAFAGIVEGDFTAIVCR
jgi:hypothetical protein